jgi:hypothetical protein
LESDEGVEGRLRRAARREGDDVELKLTSLLLCSPRQITFLTNAKDSERLELLKEVGGTTLYDEKKAESLKTLASAG